MGGGIPVWERTREPVQARPAVRLRCDHRWTRAEVKVGRRRPRPPAAQGASAELSGTPPAHAGWQRSLGLPGAAFLGTPFPAPWPGEAPEARARCRLQGALPSSAAAAPSVTPMREVGEAPFSSVSPHAWEAVICGSCGLSSRGDSEEEVREVKDGSLCGP